MKRIRDWSNQEWAEKEIREMSLDNILMGRRGVLNGGYGTQAGINFFHYSTEELKRRRLYSAVRKLELIILKERDKGVL